MVYPKSVRECAGDVVLIAEDSQLTRRAIQHVVEQVFPSSSRPCASFEEAIRTIDEINRPPTALILDVNLGSARGDGLDVGQYAQERFGCHIPTLVLTGSTALAELTERASRLRAEFLVKPQSSDVIRLFLERVTIRSSWGITDALDLERNLQCLTATYKLTQRQRQLLFTLLSAAERGERAEVNDNTRKAGLRRILRRTGHANFRELRHALKLFAHDTGSQQGPL